MSPTATQASALRRLLGNFGWKTLAEGLSRGLGLLFVVLLARRLGDEAFGLYSLPLAAAGLLAVLLDPGCHTLLIRELARDPGREALLLRQVMRLRLLASGLFLLVLLLSWPLLAHSTSLSSLLAAGAMLTGQSWIDTRIAWHNAHGAFAAEARLRFWLKLGLLLPPLLTLWLLPKVEALLWAGALAHLVVLPLLRPLQRLARGAGAVAPDDRLQQVLRRAISFWLANLWFMLYLKLDLVLLPLLGRPAAELGWYQAGLRVYELQGLGGYLLSMAAFPGLSASHAAVPERRRLLRLAGLLGLAVGLAGLPAALLLPWLLGPDFTPAVPALQILSLSVPAVYLNLALFAILAAAGKPGLTARATATCLGLNLLLNLYAIPRWGLLGAASTTLIADALLAGLLLLQLRRLPAAG